MNAQAKNRQASPSYGEVLAAYRALLAANPGKALKIGGDSVAAIIDGHLCGAYLNHTGVVDTATAFDFDQSAWDDELGCWDCDDGALETADKLNDPQFVAMPCASEVAQTHYVLAGRSFAIALEFEETEAGEREANAFMEKNPGIGVLAVADGRVILARQDDKGEPVGPIRRMLCSCCGAVTPGRQWHNRDTGYGLCVACIDYCAKRTEPGEFIRTYGRRGVHYDVLAKAN